MHFNKPKVNIRHKYLYLVCILFINIVTNAQEYIYQNFGVDDGLPNSEIYDSYQSKDGYIWFATDKGLSRYNGYEFENFNTSDGLTGHVILRFYPQKNGQIWCYTFHDKSLFYFDEIFNGFTKYEHNDRLKKHLKSGSIVKSVHLDEDNNLHIGGHYINGEIIIQNDGFIESQFSSKNFFTDTVKIKDIVLQPISDSLISEFFFLGLDLNLTNTKYLSSTSTTARIMVKWFENNERAIFMTNRRIELIFKHKPKIIIENRYSPTVIEVIDENHFFIGYEFGGGAIVDRDGVILQKFLSGQSVTSFLVDHEGGYWFTTLDFGAFYIQNPSSTVNNSSKTKYHHINSMVKTKKDELFIAFKNGTISKIAGNRKRVDFDPPINTAQAHIEYDSELDRVYIHNNSVLTIDLDSIILLDNHILKLSEPNDKTIFVGCDLAFCSIDEDLNLTEFNSPYRVHDVCIWNNDTIIGTPLGVFKNQNGDFIPMSKNSNLYDFRSDDIDTNDEKDILYVATQGAGVIVNDGIKVFNITKKDGLKSNIVNEIYLENDSTLWVCTNRGINRILWSIKGMVISEISKKDGLLSNEVGDIEIINNTVWVGTKQGLCSFPKNQMNPTKIEVPYLRLKGVIVNNVTQDTLSRSNLTYKENEIDFVLEGVSYRNKENLFYKYRLNKNKNWSTTQNRRVQFSSLSPGNYLFEAKVCIDGQSCSEKTIQYDFRVLAPFWNRWWFRLICIALLGLLVYSFFKIRVLTYNKDITREFIRLLVRRLKSEEKYFAFRQDGKDVRIETCEIIYVKSAGNYLDVHTKNKTYTIRMSIGKFLEHVPDKLEYVRTHRSYIVRIDKITSKSKSVLFIDDLKIPVSQSFHDSLNDIHF